MVTVADFTFSISALTISIGPFKGGQCPVSRSNIKQLSGVDSKVTMSSVDLG